MGLTLSNPATTVAANRLITKADTAGQTVLPSTTTSTSTTTGTSSGTFGAWVQVTASTSAEYLLTTVSAVCALVMTGPIIVEVGTGGAGSETTQATVVVSGATSVAGGTEGASGSATLPVLLRISSGTRIAVRSALHDPSGSGRAVSVRLAVVPYANVEGN